jgi:hypothetical protein
MQKFLQMKPSAWQARASPDAGHEERSSPCFSPVVARAARNAFGDQRVDSLRQAASGFVRRMVDLHELRILGSDERVDARRPARAWAQVAGRSA